MSRHKSRVTRIGRCKARAGTRKQSGGFLHLLNPFNWFKKTDPIAAPDSVAPPPPPPTTDPNAAATPGAVDPNAAPVNKGLFGLGGGSRKKSRKTRHRRRHHRK